MVDPRSLATGVATATGVAALLLVAGTAAASPVTVSLRIEGRDATAFDGPVATDVRTVDGHDGTGAHTCDGTNNGNGGSPAPTAGSALADAAQAAPFSFVANYFAPSAQGGDDLFLDMVNGEKPDYSVDQTFWAFFLNGSFASAGMCQTRVQPGDRVLFARVTGSERILELAGPATASTGQAATFTVTDASNGSPVAGATVEGQTTGADGRASVTFTTAGTRRIKAAAPSAVRSNAVSTCVHAGDDGSCGTSLPPGRALTPSAIRAPTSSLLGLTAGQRFSLRRAPRLLRGHVDLGTGALAAVRLRLRRVAHGRCSFWSVKYENWRARPCRSPGGFFYKIGDRVDWSYLMPRRLRAGRYDLHALAVDRDGLRHDAYRMFRVGGSG